MKKTALIIFTILVTNLIFGQDTTKINLNEITITSFYSTSSINNVIDQKKLIEDNYGQEPSNYLTKIPSIIAFNDNGTEFGYGYFRIRGLDQTRINVTLDGCPWNEAEDYGVYFANSPDLMSSLNSMNVNKGTTSSNNGIAGIGGGVTLESVNLYKDTTSYLYLGSGSFNSSKTTGVYNMGNRNNWGLHIKITHQETDGFREHSFNESDAFTLKTGYQFNNGATIDFMTINGKHKNGQGWLGNTFEELNITSNANGNTEQETDDWFMSMNRIQFKQVFNKTAIIASTYYQYQIGSYLFDLDNYMNRVIGEISNTNKLYDYGLTHNMIGANVTIKHYLDDLTLTYGSNVYSYNRNHYLGNQSINVDSDNYDNTGYKKDLSMYTIITYKLIKNLSLSGNIQYRFVNFNYIDNLDNSMSFTSEDMNTFWNFINFGINTEYSLNKNTKTYVKFNYTNREPTRSDMFGGNEMFIGELNTIVPEISKDFEIGMEYKSKTMYFSLNGYYMKFNNELILNGEYGLNGLPCHENVSNSYRKGIELEYNWNFINNFNIKFANSISQNKINIESLGIKNHILSPAITFDGDIFYSKDNIKIGINTNYRSKMYIDISNENSIPYLFTLNTYADYSISNWNFGIRLNNITNKINYTTAMIGANNNILYFRNAPININVFIKHFF